MDIHSLLSVKSRPEFVQISLSKIFALFVNMKLAAMCDFCPTRAHSLFSTCHQVISQLLHSYFFSVTDTMMQGEHSQMQYRMMLIILLEKN